LKVVQFAFAIFTHDFHLLCFIPQAQLALGILMARGNVRAKATMPSALELFALAAEQGNADAIFNLACLLSNEMAKKTRSSSNWTDWRNDTSSTSSSKTGSHTDSTKKWTTAELEIAAVDLWQRATAQGHAGAHFNCGVALANHASAFRSGGGRGIGRISSFRSASSSNRGSNGSRMDSSSGHRVFEGLSPGIAMVQAAAHYAAAADAGHAGAAFNLGCLHEVWPIYLHQLFLNFILFDPPPLSLLFPFHVE
jgi:TPR repeat protein